MPFDISINFSFAKSLVIIYAVQFAVFTLISYAAKGREAFTWKPEMVRSARVNWAFIASNAFIAPFALILIKGAEVMHTDIGIPVVPESFWAPVWPIVPALLAVLLVDFIDYWCHRFKHVSFLWPMHGVHHSDTSLNYTSWSRAHVVELIFSNIVLVFAATWLGAEPGMVIGVTLIRAMHQQYVHMDLDWTHGRFHLLLASPRFHHWHHADVREAYDKNFANIMPLWDKLFGTYYCPGSCTDVPMGFQGSPGDNFIKLLWFPFKEWGRMLATPFRKRAAD